MLAQMYSRGGTRRPRYVHRRARMQQLCNHISVSVLCRLYQGSRAVLPAAVPRVKRLGAHTLCDRVELR